MFSISPAIDVWLRLKVKCKQFLASRTYSYSFIYERGVVATFGSVFDWGLVKPIARHGKALLGYLLERCRQAEHNLMEMLDEFERV